jgi:plastocyanin
MTKTNVWIAGVVMPVMIAMLLLLFAGSPSVAANTDRPSAANAAVKIDNFVFGPQTITVPVGTTVTWTNSDDIPHTAVSTDGVFKSKVMDTDEKFSYTFTKAGTYSYYCSVHPKMTGQVVVQWDAEFFAEAGRRLTSWNLIRMQASRQSCAYSLNTRASGARLETEGRADAGKHWWVAGRSIFDRSDFIDQFLYRWFDCCGATSGQPWKLYGEYWKVKQVFSFRADLSLSDDRMIETGGMVTTIAEIHYSRMNSGSENSARLRGL